MSKNSPFNYPSQLSDSPSFSSVNISGTAGNALVTTTVGASYTNLINSVATTDATITTIHTITLASNTTFAIRGMIKALRTGGSSGASGDSAGYNFFGTIKNVAGTASIVSTVDLSVKEDQAAWDVSFTASGATILVKVTGAANNNIQWDLFLEQFGR